MEEQAKQQPQQPSPAEIAAFQERVNLILAQKEEMIQRIKRENTTMKFTLAVVLIMWTAFSVGIAMGGVL